MIELMVLLLIQLEQLWEPAQLNNITPLMILAQFVLRVALNAFMTMIFAHPAKLDGTITEEEEDALELLLVWLLSTSAFLYLLLPEQFLLA